MAKANDVMAKANDVMAKAENSYPQVIHRLSTSKGDVMTDNKISMTYSSELFNQQGCFLMMMEQPLAALEKFIKAICEAPMAAAHWENASRAYVALDQSLEAKQCRKVADNLLSVSMDTDTRTLSIPVEGYKF